MYQWKSDQPMNNILNQSIHYNSLLNNKFKAKKYAKKNCYKNWILFDDALNKQKEDSKTDRMEETVALWKRESH